MFTGHSGLRQQMLERLARTTETGGANGGDRPLVRRAPAGRAEARPRPPHVTVLVAESEEIVRLGIRAVLSAEKDIVVVGEAATVAETLGEAARLHPTVVIIAGALADGGALDVCRRLQATLPSVRVIVLSRDVEPASVMEAMRAGAAGYLTKRIGRAELCRAVRAVAAGEVLIDPASTRVLLEGIRRGVSPAAMPDTTPLAVQERRVLALVAQGKTNKEIAGALNLSDKTVKNYLSHAFEKLNVSRRAHAAVLFAQSNGTLRQVS
jgi:two-component system response regulator DevR